MPKKPEKGSDRPRAWLYGVLNPLVEALAREKELLARGNLTWRHRTGRPEFLATPEQYLNVSGRANLRDLLRFYPDVAAQIQRHDELLQDAVAAAKVVYDELMSSPDFDQHAMLAASEWKLAFPEEAQFWSSPAQLKGLAAERIINEIDEVPGHYVDSSFWSIAKQGLARFSTGAAMLELKRRRALLAADTDDLLRTLNALQDTICDEYDLPPAPFSVQAP